MGGGTGVVEDGEVSRVSKDLERLALLREERDRATAERMMKEKAKAEAKAAAEKAKMDAKSDKAASASSGGELDRKAVKKMNPKALKVELKKRGLSIQGNKKALQARLLETL